MSDDDAGPRSLIVELLLSEPIQLDVPQFEESIRRRQPRSRVVDRSETTVMVAHEDFMHEYADGKVAPVLTIVMAPDRKESSIVDLTQSWRFPDVASVVDSATERRLVVQMTGIAQPWNDRVRSFHVALCAAIEQLRPVAIWSPNSQQFVHPAEAWDNHLATVVNVRLFTIEGDPGAMVMDTIGMHVLRLPDLQVHFRDLDASRMAGVLYNTANYIFEEGDIIEEQHDRRHRWSGTLALPSPDGAHRSRACRARR